MNGVQILATASGILNMNGFTCFYLVLPALTFRNIQPRLIHPEAR